MSYYAQALMANDMGLMGRVTACAAVEGVAEPHDWVLSNNWGISASPGWAKKYASAKATYDTQSENSRVPSPGIDEGVISDGMILSAVQKILTDES